MNDHELDLALSAVVADRTRSSAPSALRERVLEVPIRFGSARGSLPSLSGRFQSVFSASTFVVGGVIVALFGGFLVASLLTRPSEEQLPVVGASPTATVLLPGVDLVTELVEPGVYRIVSDGVRELSGSVDSGYFPPPWVGGIVAGLDDSVWWLGSDGFFRIGEERIHAWPADPIGSGPYDDIEVGPDGTMWVTRSQDLRAFDGESWTTARTGPAEGEIHGIEVQQSGIVWLAEKARKHSASSWRIVRLEADGWRVLPGELRALSNLEMTIAEDGGHDMWVIGPGAQMQRHDGSRWGVEPVPQTLLRRPDLQGPLAADVAPDGKTLWVLLRSGSELARFDGSDWEFYGPDGLPAIGIGEPGPGPDSGSLLAAARDGSVWFTTSAAKQSECDGVTDFDGDTVRSYLRGMCVLDMDLAPDGSLWLQAGQSSFEPGQSQPAVGTDVVHTYVITPEALASTE